MTVKIALIEDSRWEHDKWDLLAEKAKNDVTIHHFYHPSEFLDKGEVFDIVVVDRTIEWQGQRVDIVTSGYLDKISKVHSGKLIYYSNAAVFRDEKHYFDKVLKGKKISSIDSIL